MPEQEPLIRHPAKYVPLAAVATGEVGGPATPISPTNPFPCSEQPLSHARALVPDTPVASGFVVLVDCSLGGTINLELSDGTQLPLTFAPGVSMLPLAVQMIASLGTSAQFSAWVLD